MDIGRVKYLHEQFLGGKLSEAESLEWQGVLDDPAAEELLLSIADGLWQHLPENLLEDMPQAVASQILSRVVGDPQRARRTRTLWTRWVAAAAIAIAVMTGGYFYYHNQFVNRNSSIVYQNDIAPGRNGATLTLGDGRKILVNEALAGRVAEELGVRISKNDQGQLVYEVLENGNKKLAYHTLSTTRGEQSQVRLPDGSLVFLNAESSLRYPNSFTGLGKREVMLSGEGYFEVSRDRLHPFIVKTPTQQLEVLGTHFNINAYGGEAGVKTTLLEGSVRVGDGSMAVSGVLKPGQQSRLRGKELDIATVDVDNAVAWKEGFFIFDSRPLELIMQDISRWYDVEIVYLDQGLKSKTFLGSVSRFSKVSKVLALLEETSELHFEIKGRQITVSSR